jgi:hypothetical protein
MSSFFWAGTGFDGLLSYYYLFSAACCGRAGSETG